MIFLYDFFHNASNVSSDKITNEDKNIQRNENVIRNLFIWLIDTCHNHTDKGCGGKGEMRAIAIKKAIPTYQESFEN